MCDHAEDPSSARHVFTSTRDGLTIELTTAEVEYLGLRRQGVSPWSATEALGISRVSRPFWIGELWNKLDPTGAIERQLRSEGVEVPCPILAIAERHGIMAAKESTHEA